MDELDHYGAFNTRYEGVGHLVYLPGDPIPVFFEVRQLADGRLLIGCVSTGKAIRERPHAIDGHILAGEPFSTMWGKGITEIYRTEGNVSKAYYFANVTRVRYSSSVEPNDHSIQFALHNFIPGPRSDIAANKFDIKILGHDFSIEPVADYRKQADRLLRYGGNLRTGWIKTNLNNESGERTIYWDQLHEVVYGIANAISLAVGTLVTSPQQIAFDPKGDRNDVEHYASDSKTFSKFICVQKWDTPIRKTIEAWFSGPRPIPFSREALAQWIRQHLDACSDEMYLETRALAAATLLDVIAGRYLAIWSPQTRPHEMPFKKKLERLLADIGIVLGDAHLRSVIKARNSLVHAGKFVASDRDIEYRNLTLLGRSILLRLCGFPSVLHEEIESQP